MLERHAQEKPGEGACQFLFLALSALAVCQALHGVVRVEKYRQLSFLFWNVCRAPGGPGSCWAAGAAGGLTTHAVPD